MIATSAKAAKTAIAMNRPSCLGNADVLIRPWGADTVSQSKGVEDDA